MKDQLMMLMISGFAEQMFNINVSKENTKFCLNLYYSHDIICVLMEKNLIKFKSNLSLKLILKMLTFQPDFV